MNNLQNIMSTLLGFTAQIHIYHWQTRGYASHMALGGLYDGIADLGDAFVETYIGVNGGNRVDEAMLETVLLRFDIDSVVSTIDSFESFLKSLDSTISNTDLLNIRDEMLALVHKTKYLLTLS